MTLVISFWRIRIWRGCGDVESLPIKNLEKIIYGYFEVMKFPNQGKIFQNVSFDALKSQNKEKPVNNVNYLPIASLF